METPREKTWTWRRRILSEAAGIGMTWNIVKREAQDRSRWKISVNPLCLIYWTQDLKTKSRKGKILLYPIIIRALEWNLSLICENPEDAPWRCETYFECFVACRVCVAPPMCEEDGAEDGILEIHQQAEEKLKFYCIVSLNLDN
uniref:SFRICE_035679 n=1 Tax=Spodoptera frugiperda TaxID=7108 RepID=A0A2H1WI29_SPOFR